MTHYALAHRLSSGGTLPEWAEKLAGACGWYEFTTQLVHDGRSVVATRSGDGTGPLVVITGREAEMREALRLPPPATPPP